MLRLSWEQFELLEQLAVRRHATSISAVLAEAWPTLTERLQDRWPAFVEAAVLQGRRHGLVEPRELARYASLWCIWGPSFDAKPGFAWASEVLADRRRSAALKLHQLTHRTRDELARRDAQASPQPAGAGPALTRVQYDDAIARVDAKIGSLAAAQTVFPVEAVASAVQPCDVATIDLLLSDPDQLQEYRYAATGWHRAAASRAADPAQRWTRAPDAPVELAVTSRALRQGAPARLNLRIDTVAICDPRVHPEVAHVGVEGRLAWKGRDTARLSLAVYAEADSRGPAAPPAGIAAPTPVDLQSVTIASCGLRDTGAPFGDVQIQLLVYPATQWLTEVSHPAWQPMLWPPEAPAAAAATTCRLERDGVATDVAAWQRSWMALQGAFREGLERVYNEWVRALDGQATRLEVDASPLVGQAGFGWGWKRSAADAVKMRTQGAVDMIAFACELQLSGELVAGEARSPLRVRCKGRSELRMSVAQLGDEAAPEQSLKAVQRSWRFPFSLELEPLAGPAAATLVAAAVPVPITGALVGECGLRARPDGLGLQWFFVLRVEPIDIVVDSVDPLLGRTRQTRKLVPALNLVDWSAG